MSSEKERAWKLANADRVKESRKRYYQKHKERTKKYSVDYQRAHPYETLLRNKAASANRRYPGSLSIADMRALVERDGRKCHWCGKDDLQNSDFTLEHLEPFNRLDCITIACLPCNTGHAGENGGRIQTLEERRAKATAIIRRWRANNREHYLATRRIYMRKYRAKQREEKLNGQKSSGD
jgi:hypothetical protein